jgi:hypothetical protein
MNASRSRMIRTALVTLGAALAAESARPADLSAQGLAEFDYENLSFRGIGFESGYIIPTRVDGTSSFGVRFDLGYLGPGVRIVPGVTYWSSFLTREEVGRFERKLEELIEREAGVEVPVDLGRISWSDVVLSLDSHLVLAFPGGVLSYTGFGVSAHIMNGHGASIEGTFVEDLLDSVTAGVNVHTGIEYAFSRARIYGVGRYEVLSNLRYGEIRLGAALMFGPAVPGEVRRRNGGGG